MKSIQVFLYKNVSTVYDVMYTVITIRICQRNIPTNVDRTYNGPLYVCCSGYTLSIFYSSYVSLFSIEIFSLPTKRGHISKGPFFLWPELSDLQKSPGGGGELSTEEKPF